jgi:hypothetical protein
VLAVGRRAGRSSEELDIRDDAHASPARPPPLVAPTGAWACTGGLSPIITDHDASGGGIVCVPLESVTDDVKLLYYAYKLFKLIPLLP